MKDALGDRMKRYESVFNFRLTPRSCVIVRIDGKAFHTFTRGFQKPFDPILTHAMDSASTELFKHVQGLKLIYTQSDEISLLLTDFDTHETQGWYDYELSKIVSVSASIVTGKFLVELWKSEVLLARKSNLNKIPAFDSRAFVIPRSDVVNYFLWRVKDCTRNSLNGFARSIFSHKDLQGKNCTQVEEMLDKSGTPWEIAERDKFGFMSTVEGPVKIVPDYPGLAEIIDPLIKPQE